MVERPGSSRPAGVASGIVLLALGLVSGTGAVPQARATPKSVTPKSVTAPQELALRVHREAAALGKLPQFYYQARFRYADLPTPRGVAGQTLEHLKSALDVPAGAAEGKPQEYTFAWDPKHFLDGLAIPADGFRSHLLLTAGDSWQRGAVQEQPATFVYEESPERFWMRSGSSYFIYGYLRVTPHQFWWGHTRSLSNAYGISPVLPAAATYRSMGSEMFGGELCDSVESVQRAERLWIGRKSGRLRGLLAYTTRYDPAPVHQLEFVRRIAGRAFASPAEYSEWLTSQASPDQMARVVAAFNERSFAAGAQVPNELIRFDDYREVSRGVWVPFRETRTYTRSGDRPEDGRIFIRTELVVTAAGTNPDLPAKIRPLLPKEGEEIVDQRFAAPVRYSYRKDRSRAEILAMVDAEHQKLRADARLVQQLEAPIREKVGKPAPELPEKGWIADRRPDLRGKPYLLHFWATWCGPCKGELPQLRELADAGTPVVGIHAPGTPAKEVARVVREQRLGYPVLVSPGSPDDPPAGYPVRMFPYCVLVDDAGKVAGHGRLSPELLSQLRELQARVRGKPD